MGSIGFTVYANFKKKSNSTKVPGGSTVSNKMFPGSFKDGVSLLSPKVAISADKIKNVVAYNYASMNFYIDGTNQKTYYYFITDWEFDSGLWIAHCVEDVLATWQLQIFGSTYYVLRAANDFNGYIQDNSYPTKTYPEIKTVELDVLTPGGIKYTIPHTYDGGCYVVGIINHDNNSVGCISYYQFNTAGFRAFCSKLMSDANWAYDGVTEISESLMKTYFNPFQYIVSCFWMPVPMFKDPTPITISYAWWSVSATCNRITSGDLEYDFFINGTLPPHPDAATRGRYLNAAPYYQAVFEWAPLGTFPINMTDNCAADRITCHIYVDMTNGKGTYSIKAWDDDTGAYSIIAQGSTMLGVPIQIAQVSTDMAGVIGGAMSSINSMGGATTSAGMNPNSTAVKDNGVGRALMTKMVTGFAGLFGLGSSLGDGSPKVQTMNTNGTICGYNLKPTMTVYIYRPVDDDVERRGRPLCERRTLSSLAADPGKTGGFVVCADAVFYAIGARADECERVTDFLNSGVFLERS